MADYFDKIGGYDELYVKILHLQELKVTTRKNVEKLIEDSRQEGTADDLKEAARNDNTKFEDFIQKFREFERDFVNQVLRPSEMQPYNKRFQEYTEELNGIDRRVRENLLILEVIQDPIEVNEAEEEQHRFPDLLETEEPQASSVADQTMPGNLEGNTLLQSDMQAMEKSYDKSPAQKLSLAAAAEARIERKKKMKASNWNLCDAIMDMYGFALQESQEIEMEVAKALTLNPYQGIDSSKEGKILDWEGVRKGKETLQESKRKSEKFQNLIPGLLKIWISRVENQVYNLVLHLHYIMSGFVSAMLRFEDLRTFLGKHRQRKNGKVPIVAHRILGLLEMRVPGEKSELNRDQQETFYRNLGFGQVTDSIHLMILQLASLLEVSGDAKGARRISANLLERCEQELGQVEEQLNGIERRIMEARNNVQNKRKREDEDGGNGSGNGSWETREKGRGKVLRRDC